TSRPVREIGRVSAWIGVHRVKPADSSPASMRACSSKLEKAISVSGLSLGRSAVWAFIGAHSRRLAALACPAGATHTASEPGRVAGFDFGGINPKFTLIGGRFRPAHRQ